ncbi:MAG: hypothetical protein PHV53_11555 [Fermentimonas sp.]|nr:hypothetical protein [Fermentimonas sp.]
MDLFVEKLKELFWLIMSALTSVLMPVKETLILLFITFVFNILTGIITDVHVNKAKFNLKKAFSAISQLTFYATCVVFLNYGTSLINEEQIGIIAVKWLTYIVVYFYLTNIFKNARQVYPNNPAINFIYELLSTELFDRLKNMVGYKTKSTNDNE